MSNAQVSNNLGKRSLLCEQYPGIRAADDNGRGDLTSIDHDNDNACDEYDDDCKLITKRYNYKI